MLASLLVGAILAQVLVVVPMVASAPPVSAEILTSVARVNFQRDTGVIPPGYLRDFGQAFDGARGYGWVEQTSSTPRSIVGNGRNRNVNVDDERLDTMVHMQYAASPLSGVPGPARWEYSLPNGTYQVTVAVGDAAASFDSSHTIAVESTPAITAFVPTRIARHQTATVRVAVTDGRVTLDAAGGVNTKVNFVDIDLVEEGDAPPLSVDFLAKVNFQRDTGPIPTGYLRDFGQAFDGARGYGWVEQNSSASRAVVGNGRNRNANLTDERLDTFIHMQYSGSASGGVSGPARWEYALANGTYEVTVSVGDALGYTDSINTVFVEDTPVIRNWVPTSATRHNVRTVQVVVTDGRLTLDAKNGVNTKVNYVDIAVVSPRFNSVTPANAAAGVPVTSSVILTPNQPVNAGSVNAGSFLVSGPDGPVEGNYNSDAAGGVVAFTPLQVFQPNTAYTVDLTSDILNEGGVGFQPFVSTFTTGAGGAAPLPVTFSRSTVLDVPGPSSVLIGPDDKLYVASSYGQVFRFARDATGAPTGSPEELPLGLAYNRIIIGIAFEPGSTPADLRLWVTHNEMLFEGASNFTGALSVFSGPDLSTRRDVLTGLPRSFRDHMTNSVAFGPDNKLYVAQGSLSGYGAPDSFWNFREETPLSGSILQADVLGDPRFQSTIDVTTGAGGYDPAVADAPVKVYADGIRNPYDLAWHSNGSLYSAVNESAGGNTPEGPGGTPPALFTVPKGSDFLARVVQGGYYGHPNPSRGYFVLNGGNPTAGADYFEVSRYPVGQQPDPNWRLPLHDFGQNRSPNGIVEYTGDAGGGALRGALLVTEFSAGDGIQAIFLNGSGNVQGVSQLATGFKNPVDITTDSFGNLFVAEFGDQPSGEEGKVTFLAPQPADAPGVFRVSSPDERIRNGTRLVFSTVASEARSPKSLTITNSGGGPLLVTGVEFGGTDGALFQLPADQAASFTVPAGATAPLRVQFRPTGPGIERYGTMTINTNDPVTPSRTIPLAGLNADGYEGSFEPPTASILRVLGYTTDVGYQGYQLCPQTGSEERPECELPRGEEIISPYWSRSDSTKPVEMIPIARFVNRMPGNQGATGWFAQAPPSQTALPARRFLQTFTGGTDISGGENQRLLPVHSGTTSFNPTSQPFGFYSYFSDFSDERFNVGKLHNMRFYPARNPAGALIPNSYILTLDPSGASAKNWDYNDLMWIVTNVSPTWPSGGTPPLTAAEFAAPIPGTLPDAGGLGTGLRSLLPGSAHVPGDLSLDPSGVRTLRMTARSGTSDGASNNQANAVGFVIDPMTVDNQRAGTRVYPPLCLPTDGRTEAGTWFGPDQDHIFKVVVANGTGGTRIEVISEQLGVRTVVASIPVANCDQVRYIDLTIRVFSGRATLGYQYNVLYNNGTSTGTIVGAERVSVAYQQLWFNQGSRMGLLANTTSASGYTAVFDRLRFYLP